MVMKKTMTNAEIYNTAMALVETFNQANEEKLQFPVKVNFYFQKNMNNLVDMAKEIETARTDIIKKYGEADPEDETKITVPQDKIEEANKELTDLFALEQEVSVNALELDWFDGIDMTAKQVAAITFMIKDEE